jgi:hypothetical protein
MGNTNQITSQSWIESSKIWHFRTLSVTRYRLGKQRENGYGQDILQQEGKGLKKGNLEHVAISNMSISIIVHYFN